MQCESELEFNVPFQHKHGYVRDDICSLPSLSSGSMYQRPGAPYKSHDQIVHTLEAFFRCVSVRDIM